ncbi:MFS transporter [Novosphingobium bradum]|uniref:MFS transporter n=1 Tax=Novosphingobium bradum TaxID=1737444 RepID=A0ABV7IM32_9SPHN
MSHTVEVSARTEWRRHWTTVLAAVFGVALTSTHVSAVGAFIAPLEQEFGWTRAQISIGSGMPTLLGGLLSPLLGIAIDRWGPRRIALPGAVIFCCATALLSQAGPGIWSWWSLWLLVALGGLMIKPPIWTCAVASLFEKGRGFALSVTLCGAGLATALMPPLATALIDHFGWRHAYVALGLMLGVITLPIFYAFLTSAADNLRRAPVAPEEPAVILTGSTVREALRSPRFYKLTVAAFVFTVAAIGTTANLVPILTSFQFSRAEAAGIAGVAGVTSLVGRLCTGLLLDRFNGNVIGGLVVVIPTITCALLLLAPGSTAMVLLAVVLLGLSLGAELDVVAYLTTRHFGMARYGTIFGAISGFWAIAASLGPTFANYLYDQTGSYAPAITTFLPLYLVASFCLATLGRFPVFPRPPAAA